MANEASDFMGPSAPEVQEVLFALFESGATTDGHISGAEIEALGYTQQQLDAVAGFLESSGESVTVTWDTEIAANQSNTDSILDTVNEGLGEAVDVVAGAMQVTQDMIRDFWGDQKDHFDDLIGQTKDNVLDPISSGLESIAGLILAPIEYLIESLISGTQDGSLFENVLEMFGNMIRTIVEATVNISEDVIVDGMLTMHKAQMRVNAEILDTAQKEGIV